MPHTETTKLILIRHAPTDAGGRLAGRRDPPAILPDAEKLARARTAAADRGGDAASLVTSPARRCRETAGALFPGKPSQCDPRLWEQDFGDWEGLRADELPDLGSLGRDEIAAHRPPRGESFLDLCERTTPALAALDQGGTVAVVAHAGTIRAALGLALGQPSAGLSFAIGPLSVTGLTMVAGGGWSVDFVNRPLS